MPDGQWLFRLRSFFVQSFTTPDNAPGISIFPGAPSHPTQSY